MAKNKKPKDLGGKAMSNPAKHTGNPAIKAPKDSTSLKFNGGKLDNKIWRGSSRGK